jgi:hypothetical protein
LEFPSRSLSLLSLCDYYFQKKSHVEKYGKFGNTKVGVFDWAFASVMCIVCASIAERHAPNQVPAELMTKKK